MVKRAGGGAIADPRLPPELQGSYHLFPPILIRFLGFYNSLAELDFFSPFSALKPTDRISPAMFGAAMTEEEAELVNKR